MSELEIREIVTVARYLLGTFNKCTTEKDFDRFSASLSNLCADACAKMQTIMHCSTHDAADVFMQIVTDDAKLETFIAQAFVAQITCGRACA